LCEQAPSRAGANEGLRRPRCFLLVRHRLRGLVPIVGWDERETLVRVGPVAELNLGGVPAGELEGGVAEVLEPLFGVAGRLDVRRDAPAEPALLMITLPTSPGPPS
jgi:hypothetical protein